MKKKALITSTVLLLVAIMCLATASYAWFTVGGANKISTFNLNIDQTDGLLELSVVEKTNKTAKGWNSSLSSGLFNSSTTSLVPTAANSICDPVSGTGAVASDYSVSFYNTTYNDETQLWGSATLDTANYIKAQFYVKAPAAGTATLSYTGTVDDQFKTAGYMSVDVSAATVGTDSGTKGDSVSFKTYALGDLDPTFKVIGGANATSAVAKFENGSFEPNAEIGFVNTTISAPSGSDLATISFAGENEVKLVTVCIWLEGMDDQCKGSWDGIENDFSFALSFVQA